MMAREVVLVVEMLCVAASFTLIACLGDWLLNDHPRPRRSRKGRRHGRVSKPLKAAEEPAERRFESPGP